MKMKYLVSLCAILLSGCATTQLQHLHNQEDPLIKQKINKARSLKIRNGETVYSKKLECLGDKFFAKAKHHFSNPDGSLNYAALKKTMTISVAPILDKTQKVYPANSTAISDLVINALHKIKGFAVVETPLDSTDIAQSRNNFGAESSFQFANENISYMLHSIHRPPIGIVFPTRYYITGALIQYDDTTEIGNKNLNMNMKYVTGKSNVSQISIGLNLRLIDASTGTANINIKTNKTTNVFLQNDLWKISNGINFFRIISTSPWGIDYSVNTADPVHYAVNEIVERGVYDLMKPQLGLTEIEERECDNANENTIIFN